MGSEKSINLAPRFPGSNEPLLAELAHRYLALTGEYPHTHYPGSWAGKLGIGGSVTGALTRGVGIPLLTSAAINRLNKVRDPDRQISTWKLPLALSAIGLVPSVMKMFKKSSWGDTGGFSAPPEQQFFVPSPSENIGVTEWKNRLANDPQLTSYQKGTMLYALGTKPTGLVSPLEVAKNMITSGLTGAGAAAMVSSFMGSASDLSSTARSRLFRLGIIGGALHGLLKSR